MRRQRPFDVLIVEQRLHRSVVGDQRAAGIEGGELVCLPRPRLGLPGSGQTRSQQLVDLLAKSGAALGSTASQCSGDIVVKGQGGAHEYQPSSTHQNISGLMQCAPGSPPGAALAWGLTAAAAAQRR